MALVTIGVPVYNGAKLIGECLDCLTQQTLKDIEIVVSDNASTDDTGAIVSRYASSDSRIRYIRQPKNIGLVANFKAVLDAAASPYFMFRCHDDLSSLNYAEALHGTLSSTPGAKLAVPNIETHYPERPPRSRPVPQLSHISALLDIRDLLFNSQAAWFCGLWEREALQAVFNRVCSQYDTPWGPDHLTLYPFLINRSVALVPHTTFVQRVTRKQEAAAYSRPKLTSAISLRRVFLGICRDFRRELGITGFSEHALATMTWFYAGKRVYAVRNIVRRALLGRW